jgi:hypothetical protein
MSFPNPQSGFPTCHRVHVGHAVPPAHFRCVSTYRQLSVVSTGWVLPHQGKSETPTFTGRWSPEWMFGTIEFIEYRGSHPAMRSLGTLCRIGAPDPWQQSLVHSMSCHAFRQMPRSVTYTFSVATRYFSDSWPSAGCVSRADPSTAEMDSRRRVGSVIDWAHEMAWEGLVVTDPSPPSHDLRTRLQRRLPKANSYQKTAGSAREAGVGAARPSSPPSRARPLTVNYSRH